MSHQPAPAKKTRRARRKKRLAQQPPNQPSEQQPPSVLQRSLPDPIPSPEISTISDVKEQQEEPRRSYTFHDDIDDDFVGFTRKLSRKGLKKRKMNRKGGPKKKAPPPASPFQSIKVQKTSPVKAQNTKKLKRQISRTLAAARQQPRQHKKPKTTNNAPSSARFDVPRSLKSKDTPKARRRAAAKMLAHSALSSGVLSGMKFKSAKPRPPFRGLTENGAVTLTTSGNPLVDFFFQVLPSSFEEQVHEYLTAAWDHDPLSALKLVFQLRDIRQGKGDREQFYVCLDWMVERHPETLLANLELFPIFGYWKDLLMFMFRIFEGKDGLQQQRDKVARIRTRRDANNARITQHKIMRYLKIGDDFNHTVIAKKRAKRSDVVNGKPRRQVNIANNLAAGKVQKRRAHERRVAQRAEMEGKLADKMESDPIFAQFYDRVVELFAKQLARDLDLLHNGETRDVSLCAKWAPRLGGSFDRRVKLGRMIAYKMFPNQTLNDLPGWNGEDQKTGGPDEQELSNRIACERYRKEVCVPLRRSLECPEIAMSARRWTSVNYERTPSVAMSANAKHFLFHDGGGFRQYLRDVANGTKKIACGAVMPHDLVRICTPSHNEVAGLQFEAIIRKLRDEGSFSNSVAVCDVSGSMNGLPMEAAVAFSMILAELNEGIWRNQVITFHERPAWFVIPKGNLHTKVAAMKAMSWGGSTNYHAVFTLIREMAVTNKVQPAEMVRRLYVFSDMEFNMSGGGEFETTHEQIKREFESAGLSLPQIVFWNLRSGTSQAIPASASEQGVALVSGFSAQLLKIFMDGADADFALEGRGNSEDVLDTILASDRYQVVQNVVD